MPESFKYKENKQMFSNMKNSGTVVATALLKNFTIQLQNQPTITKSKWKNHRQRDCSICNTKRGKKQEIQNLWKKTVIKVSHRKHVPAN